MRFRFICDARYFDSVKKRCLANKSRFNARLDCIKNIAAIR